MRNPELADYRGYKQKFPGGFYRPNRSIIEDLESINIFLPDPTLVLNPYMLIFDIESLLPRLSSHRVEDVDEIAQGEDFAGMIFAEKHKPVSMSIVSNIPSFESKDLVNFEGGSVWIQHAMKFMVKVSEKAAEHCSERSN